MKEVVLFDFDGTLTSRDTSRYLIIALLRTRMWLLPKILQPLWRLVLGGPEEAIQSAKDRSIGRLLCGISSAQLETALSLYSRAVRPLLRPLLMDKIRAKSSVGQHVLIVTASAEIAVTKALSANAVTVLGTRFEMVDGRFTGALDGVGCYGPHKVERIRAWGDLQTEKWTFVEAWSDSLSDLPMMMLADRRNWICAPKHIQKYKQQDPLAQIMHFD